MRTAFDALALVSSGLVSSGQSTFSKFWWFPTPCIHYTNLPKAHANGVRHPGRLNQFHVQIATILRKAATAETSDNAVTALAEGYHGESVVEGVGLWF